MRPNKLDDFVGQGHFLYKGSLVYNAIKNKTFDSAIFFGPSGTGKTTLARIVANEMDAGFKEINASVTGTKELKEIIENAKLRFYGIQKESTFLYIDEFHRWNKLQQDSLLKALEEGVIRFIGSTTENPYFAVNNAILSRVRNIYEFYRLTKEDVLTVLRRCMKDEKNGLGAADVICDDDKLEMIADISNGDARIALDTLGFIVSNIDEGSTITKDLILEATQRRASFYDKEEDKYNYLSALQKSVRGSDPDAAIFYLAKLIEGGGDLMMISRRLLVMASEDIGMAYPNIINIVTSCVQAAQMVGFPEAQINLAQAVITMASSPKSNRSVEALYAAQRDIKKIDTGDVPAHLKDNHYSGAKNRGHGIGYKYPHSYGGYIKQQYLPDKLVGKRYYEPSENGSEKQFKQFLERIPRFTKEDLKNKE